MKKRFVVIVTTFVKLGRFYKLRILSRAKRRLSTVPTRPLNLRRVSFSNTRTREKTKRTIR